MSLREWLVAIGALIIIVIVVDGLRRMRRARKDAMAISSGMGADDIEKSPLDEDYNPELPNGGARPVSRDTLEERGYLTSAKAPGKEPQETFAAHDPMESGPDATVFGPAEPVIDRDPVREAVPSEELPQDPEEDEVLEVRPARPVSRADRKREMKTGSGSRAKGPAPRKVPEPPTVTEVEEDTAIRGPRSDAARAGQPQAGANRPPAEEVVVINVLAREQEEFSGSPLRKLFEACGLEHGDLDIFHRHETADTNSPVQFSVANAVEPGTFEPARMDRMSTPGISFFMSLPGPRNPMQAFDFMLETAQAVVRNLGGELKDERRSVMTAQTIEHCRQRIREYERKRRSRR
ncbi:cell division protein ZipA [Marinobacter daqiaonensis]|uniref:Cell division protein ZipA n=1 Tax=Marinobacter daqiaonensis TaxID=650891 RepID=A0A1I6GML0_9GAMM|nr:cell division protein ZipA [Marinobacter daqiaonensis]SFR43424.1 cell division protein ZipA [Marinobacter daqiaonensis]